MFPGDPAPSPAGITLRDAGPGDIGAICRIYAHYVRNGTATFEIEAPDEAELRTRMEAIQAKGLPYVVAERGGRVIGYAYANSYRPREAYRYTVEDSIYIDAEETGRGAGALLLERLLERCRETGARQMIAVIGGSDNVASIRLHERFGFTTVGVLRGVGFKFGEWLDTTLLQRAL